MLLNYCKFEHTVDDKKPDVVLIHGTGGDASLWDPQIKMLQENGYRCIVPELRGHGGTHEPKEETDVNAHCVDVLETLADAKVRYPAIFVGHSLGAFIAMEIAHSYPERVTKVLSVSMPGKVLGMVTFWFKALISCPYEFLRGSIIHRSLSKRYQILFSTDRFSLKQIVVNFETVSYMERILNVQCPVHFCVGRLDWVAPYVFVKRMQKNFPNSTFCLFNWSGHTPMDDEPDKFNQWFMEKIYDTKTTKLLESEVSP